MAKGKKTQRRGSRRLPAAARVLSAEAEQELRQRRFQQAIEKYRLLKKRYGQRPEWLAQVMRAYEGRAEELLRQGEAAAALSMLLELGDYEGALANVVLHFRALLAAGVYREALQAYRLLCANSTVPPGAYDSALAAYALAFHSEFEKLLPAADPLVCDYGPVFDSLQALARSDDDTCQSRLSQIGVRSPYKDYRFLLGGLLAFYRNDAAEAKTHWRRVSATSVLHSVAGALIRIADTGSRESVKAIAQSNSSGQDLLELFGIATADVNALGKIIAALQRQDYRAVFFALRKYQRLFDDSRLRRFCQALLLQDVRREPQYQSLFPALSPFESERARALYYESQGELARALRHWKKCLNLIDRESKFFRDPAEKKLAKGLILNHLTDIRLGQVRPPANGNDKEWDPWFDDEFSFEGIDDYDPEWLKEAQESLKFDPGNKDVYAKIIWHYQANKSKTKTGKWLAAMARQFPEDPEVLFQVANQAFQRKAYKTAYNYIEQLLALDPINQPARNFKISIHITKARKHIKERNFRLARREYELAMASEEPRQRDGGLQIKWGLMELLANEAERGIKLLRSGMASHGDHAGTLLIVEIEACRINLPSVQIAEQTARLAELMRAQPTAEVATQLVRSFLPYLMLDSSLPKTSLVRVISYLKRAKKCKFDSAELLLICDCLRRVGYENVLLKHYAGIGKKNHPEVIRFTYFYYLGKCDGQPFALGFDEVKALTKAAERARHQGDEQTSKEILELLEPLEALPAFNRPPRGGPRRGPFNNMLNELLEELLTELHEDDDEDEEPPRRRSSRRSASDEWF